MIGSGGRANRLGSIGGAEGRGYGQVLVRLIVPELQFGKPAGLSGPIRNELLLVDGGRWWWWRRSFSGRGRGLCCGELRRERDRKQHG
jgi:hypothetical protein